MNDAAPLHRFFNAPLAETDPELAAAIGRELVRQQDGIELSRARTSSPAPCWRRRARC